MPPRGHAGRTGREMKAKGARVLGDGSPKIGAHGKPVLFLHPKDFAGDADRDRRGLRVCGIPPSEAA